MKGRGFDDVEKKLLTKLRDKADNAEFWILKDVVREWIGLLCMGLDLPRKSDEIEQRYCRIAVRFRTDGIFDEDAPAVTSRAGTPPLDVLWRYHHVNEKELDAAMSGGSDTNSDKQKKNLPDNEDVLGLIRALQRELPQGRSQSAIARDYTGEMLGDEREAQNLLRQARRFSHLWR